METPSFRTSGQELMELPTRPRERLCVNSLIRKPIRTMRCHGLTGLICTVQAGAEALHIHSSPHPRPYLVRRPETMQRWWPKHRPILQRVEMIMRRSRLLILYLTELRLTDTTTRMESRTSPRSRAVQTFPAMEATGMSTWRS